LPEYEIFVYSARFEGVHLRCGKVARGGLRWSDRREDFRTEVLGLMKAQQVKNSVIVPTGAKGGFFVKSTDKSASREIQLREGIDCYKNFIRGLLDITDNIIEGELIKPQNTVCYDGDDPYLVVAADKGTASFSDIANDISAEYGFWLKDAFASGGKTGYDHKKMGITAKGAWVSVKRHFKNIGVDIQQTDFTVAGIGDMSGDVFGNGMLLSEHICLVAAFDHRHIFIDPKPVASVGFTERTRLFNLPRSSWESYNKKLISKGGGIFSRAEKSIKLPKECQQLLRLEQSHIVPNDLIRAILQMNVDLLWNGGIGTYVKASTEENSDAGDRANDMVRVNGNELNCKIVGEGGNLGLTQSARVEFALAGGQIYTDFIDNAAGVDCSDKEVNIKILLNSLVDAGQLSYNQRNRMLKDMTDEVSHLVLHDNEKQTLAIELAKAQALKQVDLYGRFANLLEDKKIIERDLESFPSTETLELRKIKGKGLTAPEISVLVSYSKILLQTRLLNSTVPEDAWLARYLFTAFPKRITKRFNHQLMQHSLRREIITTQLSNELVNEGGAVFIYRMYHETGATYTDIVRAYVATREIFGLHNLWGEIKALDYKVPTEIQTEMMLLGSRIVRRSSRWFIRKYRENLNISEMINQYKPVLQKMFRGLSPMLVGERKTHYEEFCERFREYSVPESLIQKLSLYDAMFSAFDIIDASVNNDLNLTELLRFYFEIGQYLNLSWLRYQIRKQKNETHWDGLALAGIFDDIDAVQTQLTVNAIRHGIKSHSIEQRVEEWSTDNERLTSRWLKLITSMRSSQSISPVMLFVGLRELSDLAESSMVAD
jgi:glutamate dehydrogenase